MPTLRATLAFGLVLAGLGIARPAGAHFVLDTPDSWMSQDTVGLPEKGPPCGNEGGGTVSNLVTAYRAGDSVTITIEEKVFHPGHYRIALATAADRSDLPPEPVVTADSNSDCGSVPVQSPPVFPVLADNVFPHTAPFTAPQTVTIQLPSNVTCTKCTLQVIEFMGDHALNVPGGCFYHHCADISIGPVLDDGGSSMPDASTSPNMHADASASVPAPSATKKSGCSMGAGSAMPGIVVLAMFALATLALRRRRA